MHNNFINSVVKKIFPEGTESTQENRISPSQYKYWVIPGKENEPRWLVPDKPDGAWPLLEQWSPYDLPSRIKWKFLKMAYKGKCFSLIPHYTVVDQHSRKQQLGILRVENKSNLQSQWCTLEGPNTRTVKRFSVWSIPTIMK